jgi:hypothetical protein
MCCSCSKRVTHVALWRSTGLIRIPNSQYYYLLQCTWATDTTVTLILYAPICHGSTEISENSMLGVDIVWYHYQVCQLKGIKGEGRLKCFTFTLCEQDPRRPDRDHTCESHKCGSELRSHCTRGMGDSGKHYKLVWVFFLSLQLS